MSTAADTTTKTCSRCREEKPLSEFSWRNREDGVLQSSCKSCSAAATRRSRLRDGGEAARARDRVYHEAHRDERNAGRRERYDKDAQRMTRVQQLYGLTVEQYNEILARQDGVCAVCKDPETLTVAGTVRALTVDHDHDTGMVRGLLCSGCNTGIGHLRDDPERLRAAAEYLEDSVKLKEEMLMEVRG